MNIMETIEQEETRTDLSEIKIGDDVDVAVKIAEGEKERTQVFSGTVIAKRGSGPRRTFTVRRVVQGEGVERIFPLSSPAIVSIKTTRSGKTKRSKLYYLRKRVGKATKVRESLEAPETAGGEPEGPPARDEDGTTPEANDGQEASPPDAPQD